MATETSPIPRSPALTRTRVLLAAAGAAVVLLIVVAVLALAGGQGEEPPATGAAALVPADALVYVNLSTDPSRPGVKRALTLASRFPSYPLLSAGVRTRLAAIAGGSSAVDFSTQIRPWLGDEAALALLNTPSSTAGSLLVLDVRDKAGAESFLSQAGASAAGSYRGTELRRYGSGTELAFIGRFLVLGQDASVRAALDVSAGATPSLRSSEAYRRASAGEDDGRVIDAYISPAGVRRVLAAQGGILGALGALLYQPTLQALTASLTATGAQTARIRIHSALDPGLARLGSGAQKSFTPSLQDVMPAGSLLMLDVTGLNKVAPRVLNAGASGGVAGRIGPLLSRLGAALQSEGVNVSGITSLFTGESAVAITPGTTTGAAVVAANGPALTIVTRTRDQARTRTELAQLELPLEQLFPATGKGAGQAPVFNDRQIDGVTVHELALAPGLNFDYAVSNGLVILSTSLGAVGDVIAHSHSLTGESLYEQAFPASPKQVTSLLFLDFSQLLNLGEQTGLTRSARYRALRADLREIRSVGLASTSGEADSTAELFLKTS